MHLSLTREYFRTHLNELNLQLQGSGSRHLESVEIAFIILEDKFRAYIRKLKLCGFADNLARKDNYIVVLSPRRWVLLTMKTRHV